MRTAPHTRSIEWLTTFVFASVLLAVTAAPSALAARGKPAAWTAADLYASPSSYALGHRGYGDNTGTDPTRPIENTLDAFHRAFQDGIRVVELDLQMTADGKVVVIHDDYLPDYTCINTLTYDQLLALRPETPLFRSVLNSCRHFSGSDQLSGIIFAEIKVPVPLCDGSNSSEQADITESALVEAVVADIRQAGMEEQVILNSGSPSILHHALLQAPEIKRALSLNVLQMISPAVAQQMLGMPVVKIARSDCGLDWYNVGLIARLPSFYATSGPSPFARFVGTALGCAGSTAVSIDKQVLGQAGAGAPALVAALHAAGLEVVVWTIESLAEWNFVEAAGADGITTNDIALGLAEQAPLPSALATLAGTGAGSAMAESLEPLGGEAARLALALPRSNPSRDGTLRIAFALPDGGPARLEMVDIAGRQIESRDVGSFGAGRHELSLGRGLSPGIYFVRLTNSTGRMQAKATVVR